MCTSNYIRVPHILRRLQQITVHERLKNISRRLPIEHVHDASWFARLHGIPSMLLLLLPTSLNPFGLRTRNQDPERKGRHDEAKATVLAIFKPRQGSLALFQDLRHRVVELESCHTKLKYQRSKPVQRGQKATLLQQRLI
jgi:hypothetical protein